jgi:uncharacterized protein (DUF2237 family)
MPGLYQGVIAQELLGTEFEFAVYTDPITGYYTVNYCQLGVEFKLIDLN